MPRCPAKTHSGKRCKNPTTGRSKHCATHQKRSNRGARRRQRQALIGTLTQSRQGQLITNRRMSTRFKLKVPLTMKSDSRKSAERLYVFPKQKIYPIGNLYHARKAINYIIAFPSTRSEAGDVVRAVVKAYPEYDWKAYWDSKIKRRKAGQKKLGSFNSYLKGKSNPTKRRNSKPLWSKNQWSITWYDPRSKWRGFHISGNGVSDHPTIYADGTIAYDRPEAIPQYVRRAVESLARKYHRDVRYNPSGVHQSLGAHASYGPEGLQTKQARLNPRRKMNRSKLPEVGKIYGSEGDYILVDAVYEPDQSYRSGYVSYTAAPLGWTAKTLIEKDRRSGQAQWERLLSPSPHEVGMMSGGMTGADWSRAGYRKANKLPLGWKKLYAGWRKKMKGNPRKSRSHKKSNFKVGDSVRLTLKGLQQFNRDRPYSRASNQYSRALGEMYDAGLEGKVSHVFPSGGMNVNFMGHIFDIKPYMVEKVSKSNPRRRKNASGAHGPLGQHASFGPAGLVTKQGGLPAYGPWHRRKNGFVGSDAEAQELALYISNDGDLYRQQTTSIITNLAKKMAKRTFDRAKAVKLFKYLADNGAKKYSFDFGDRQPGVRSWHSYKGFGPFTPDIRRQAAAMLLEEYMESIQYEADLIAAKSKKNPRRKNPRSKPNPRRRNGMMKAKWSPVNQAWFVFFGDSPISIQGQMTFRNKSELKDTLAEQGLKLKSNNDIVADGPNPFSKESRNPHCKPNPRNVKVDIELPKTNLRVVGAGRDVNGNKVIRFAIGANRGFAKQVGYSGILHASWSDIMFDKKIKKPSAFAKAAIERIRAHGSAAQKKIPSRL